MELVTVAITGIIVSVLTSLFKTVNLTKTQRSVLALVMSVLGGFGMVIVQGQTLSVDNIANTIVATFTAAQIVYVGILKNSSLNGTLESFNFFSSKNEKNVAKMADGAEEVAKKVVKKKATATKKPAVKKTPKA
jgi:hypothetical protein